MCTEMEKDAFNALMQKANKQKTNNNHKNN